MSADRDRRRRSIRSAVIAAGLVVGAVACGASGGSSAEKTGQSTSPTSRSATSSAARDGGGAAGTNAPIEPAATTAPPTSPPTTLSADPVQALRNARIVEPAKNITVQLVDGKGETTEDYTSPGYVSAQLRDESRGTVWPAIGILLLNYGGSGAFVNVVALDPSGTVHVSEAIGNSNNVSRVEDVNGVIEVDYTELGPGDSLGNGGTVPAKATFDPATGVLTKVPGAQPQRLDPNGLTTDGVRPLVFGDPTPKATAITGKSPTPICGTQGEDATISDALPGLSLRFGGGRFSEYSTSDPRYSTPSGGRVGMSAAQVQAKIPTAKREAGPYGNDVLAVHSGANVLLFVLSGERVTQITAGKDGSTGFGC